MIFNPHIYDQPPICICGHNFRAHQSRGMENKYSTIIIKHVSTPSYPTYSTPTDFAMFEQLFCTQCNCKIIRKYVNITIEGVEE